MQQSMTGFGYDECIVGQFKIKSEIKSLNSKFLDFSCRLPKELSSKESELRTIASEKLKRGKSILAIEIEHENQQDLVIIDEALFKNYYHTFKELANEVGAASIDLFQHALNVPDVIKQAEINHEEIPWQAILDSINRSIDQCITFRIDEGTALTDKLTNYITTINQSLNFIEKNDHKRVTHLKEKLKNQLENSEVKVDENRYEQEIIFYLEKMDITEEKVRLKKHLNYFIEVIKNEKQAGKKLGFISQEIGREINTIGSKANDAEIQRAVVEMKDELEKVKEQLLNIL